jgi:hypothetical protein
VLILVFAIPLLAIFSQCQYFTAAPPDQRGELYAGSSTCIKCHKDVYTDYLHTAHFNTTRLANEHSISGSFKPGSNVFAFNKDLKVVMEKRDSGWYQVAYLKGKVISAQRFDITFGGVKAETYLYWKGNQLYQLPMSYFKALHNWTNSPGYNTSYVDFNRPIGTRCFECHSSYIKELPQQTHSLQRDINFDKTSLILGIDCERCHGPALNHVNYQTAYPEEKKAKYITTYASLSRVQKIDMCAVCHSGNSGTMLRSTFAFKPGDDLAKFKVVELFQTDNNPDKLDVHGNQSQLLQSSKCFMMSKMDCITCHNVHTNDRQQIAMYSQKCMGCHTMANHNFCPEAPKLGAVIKTNCIDCHMPAKPSNVIAVGTSLSPGMAVPYLVRTHRIAIYADAAQAVINKLKNNNQLPVN